MDLQEIRKNFKRKILHLDMDYFYAQIEIRDNPELKNKLVVIAKDSPRSVICTCSYNARLLGIHSAMSVAKAKQICNDLVFIPPRMEKYKKVNQQIIKIIREYSDIIEPVSLDEAYIDVTFNKIGEKDPFQLAKEIQFQIFDRLHLTCSIGVSYNKFLAKISSELNKPNGIFVIDEDNVNEILSELPISEFRGIGQKTLETCYKHSIFKGKDLLGFNLEQTQIIFGEKLGEKIYNQARGKGDDVVKYRRDMHSISCEETMIYDLSKRYDIENVIKKLANELVQKMLQKKMCGKTLTLKIKFNDFQTVTRSHTFPYYISHVNEIYQQSLKLLDDINYQQKPIRLIGIGVSKLTTRKVLKKQKKFKQLRFSIFKDLDD